MQLLPRDTASILVLPSLLGGPQEGRWGADPLLSRQRHRAPRFLFI